MPDETGATMVQVATAVTPGQDLGFRVSGTGTLEDAPADARDGRPGGGLGTPEGTPDPLHRYRWAILAWLAGALTVGAVLVVKEQTVPAAIPDELELQKPMSSEQRMLFQSEMDKHRKSPITAFVLCLFLGGLGFHYYYLRRIPPGVLSTLFSWTLIPLVVAIFNLFTIRRRVEYQNYLAARGVADRVLGLFPGTKNAKAVVSQ
jgi:TM2 domain-containing membrane protein YozV